MVLGTVNVPEELVLRFETLKWVEQELGEQKSKIGSGNEVKKARHYLKEAVFPPAKYRAPKLSEARLSNLSSIFTSF